MYYKLHFNKDSAEARRDMCNNYEMHRTISRIFPAGCRPLFRLINDGKDPRIYIVCRESPDWNKLPSGYCSGIPYTSQSEYELRKVSIGMFNLLANPTIKDNRTKKRIAIKDGRILSDWLTRKEIQHGFKAYDVTYNVSWLHGKNDIPLYCVEFKGKFRVTDIEKFNTCLYSGIGSQKAFGFGLMLHV